MSPRKKWHDWLTQQKLDIADKLGFVAINFTSIKNLPPRARERATSNDEIRKRAKIHVKFTEHARSAMREDDVTVDDVISALAGKMIKNIPTINHSRAV